MQKKKEASRGGTKTGWKLQARRVELGVTASAEGVDKGEKQRGGGGEYLVGAGVGPLSQPARFGN